MGWGARFAGVLVAGAVLASAAACGGAGPEGQALPAATSGSSAEPSETPTATAGPTKSPEPSPADSSMPVAARDHTAKGAEAFVRHWITVANEAFATGDVGPWRALGLAACKSCEKRIAAVEKTYGTGGRITGGKLEAEDVAGTPLKAGETPQVLVEVAVSREVHLDSAGKTVSEHEGRATPVRVLPGLARGRVEGR